MTAFEWLDSPATWPAPSLHQDPGVLDQYLTPKDLKAAAEEAL